MCGNFFKGVKCVLVTLCSNNDEKNVIDKVLSMYNNVNGVLRDASSIIDPVITVEIENPSNYNYAIIPDFNRHYFITNITSIRNGLWQIEMHVDVLKSFADQIKSCRAILANSETTNATPYMEGDLFRSLVKDKTDIIKFQHGLLESGEYILITAGG